MTSKHCPDRDICRYAGSCQVCVHSRQYERLAHKITDLYAESKRFKQELAQARRAYVSCTGAGNESGAL